MNQAIRPTVFEFNRYSTISPRQSPKNSSSTRFKAQTHVGPFKLIFHSHQAGSVKIEKREKPSPIKNFGLSFTSRRSSKFGICQFQEIPPGPTSPPTGSPKRTFRNRYFNEAQARKIGFSLRANSKALLNSTVSGNSSLRTVLEEIWKEPSDLIERKRQKFTIHAKMRRSLKKSTQSCEAKALLKPFQDPAPSSSNCVCIQTDDLDYPYL